MQEIRRYLIPAEGAEELPIKKSLILAKELCNNLKRNVILFIPVKNNLKWTTLENVIGKRNSKTLLNGGKIKLCDSGSIHLRTIKTYNEANVSEIVLAVYVNQKMLNLIDDSKNASAIIIVPWFMDELKNWIMTWNPMIIGENDSYENQFCINPIIEEVLKLLTNSVNLSSSLTNDSDKAKVVQIFRKLRKKNIQYDPVSIRAWAVKNGWSTNGADQLKYISQSIIDHKPIHCLKQQMWKLDIIEQIIRKINSNEKK